MSAVYASPSGQLRPFPTSEHMHRSVETRRPRSAALLTLAVAASACVSYTPSLAAAQSRTTSKLRLLVLHPKARGLGLGRRLTQACIRFARRVGYRKMALWTQSHLAAARAIYQAEGFRKISEEKHRSFGKRLVAEVWELKL